MKNGQEMKMSTFADRLRRQQAPIAVVVSICRLLLKNQPYPTRSSGSGIWWFTLCKQISGQSPQRLFQKIILIW